MIMIILKRLQGFIAFGFVVLPNKPIRRPGTTPMGDSSSVTAVGRCSLMKSLEAEVAIGTLKKLQAGNI